MRTLLLALLVGCSGAPPAEGPAPAAKTRTLTLAGYTTPREAYGKAILPAFAIMLGVKQGFAQFFGGTSLLIMVGVLLDTLQQIESHLLMRHYDGLMKGGRIKGRTSAALSMATG